MKQQEINLYMSVIPLIYNYINKREAQARAMSLQGGSK